MNQRSIALTPDVLVAYVDRELPADQLGAIDIQLIHDAAARDLVHKLRVSAEIAKGSAADVLNEPLPLRLVAAARGRSVPTAARTRNSLQNRQTRPWLWPLAASVVALAVGLGGGYVIRDRSAGYVAASAPDADTLTATYEATLLGSLDTNAAEGTSFTYDSAGVGQGKITLGRRFTTSFHRDCREFSRDEVRGIAHSTGDGLACRTPDGDWTTMFFRNQS
jgi:surface antigen